MEIRADLHIHTVLSPCGDLDMSPANIIGMALQKGLSLIGISDHNSTRQAPVIQQLGEQQGLRVLCGTEVNTAEEVHALAYFPTLERLTAFQHFLDLHLPDIKNNPDKFGYQVVVDAEEQITYEEERLLITALDVDINTIERTVHALDGIFIPAHIDKSRFSILSQLGFVPKDLKCEALELSPHTTREQFLQQNAYLSGYTFIRSSDAHYVDDIGKVFTSLSLPDLSFDSIRAAITR